MRITRHHGVPTPLWVVPMPNATSQARADDDDLVPSRAAGNLVDDVSAVDFLFGRRGLEIDAQPHGLFLFEEPRYPAVALGRDE